jgi:isopropylmalate/homocitrate/citramalate synthase
MVMIRNAEEPWLSDHWAASRYNFAGEIAVPPRPVQLHDITIRDGEECADGTYSTQDKVRIAEALVRAGIRRTELFLTAPGWLEAVRTIMQRCPQLDLYVTWQPGRVERALAAGVRHVMVWYRIGDVWQQHVSRRPRQDLMDEMLAAVAAARSAGVAVNLFLPEMTRASMEHIIVAARAAENAGATAVTAVDSQSSARPAAIAYLVR